MAHEFSAGESHGQPATSAHKYIGTLNVVFASLLLLAGLCCGSVVLMQIAMAPMGEEFPKAVAEQQKADRQRDLDRITEQEATATTDEEKAALAARRKAIERRPEIDMEPMADMMAVNKDPRYVGCLLADFSTGLVLNVLLFISGLGLLSAKGWARRLAVWVAALKIVRLLAVYGFFAFVVAPIFSQKMANMMDKMAAQVPRQQPGPPPMQGMGKTVGAFYGISMTSIAVLMVLIGVIYPIVTLWVLTRPKVKLACGEAVADYPVDAP